MRGTPTIVFDDKKGPIFINKLVSGWPDSLKFWQYGIPTPLK